MKKYLCLGVVAIMSMMILGACDSNQENNTTNDLPQENNQQADVSQTDTQQTATYECISLPSSYGRWNRLYNLRCSYAGGI